MRPLVLVPVYRPFPHNDHEELAMQSIMAHLPGFDKATIGPAEHYAPLGRAGFQHVNTPADYWKHESSRAYNPLMCSPGLYRAIEIAGYTHVLIHHLDAVTFYNGLEHFCLGAWDIIGAPCWGIPDAMNGGYTIRRVSACLDALDGLGEWVNIDRYWGSFGMNEDHWWTTRAPRIRVAPRMIAIRFAWETEPETCWRLNGQHLPMGAHSTHQHDLPFWEGLGGFRALALGPFLARALETRPVNRNEDQLAAAPPVDDPATLIDHEDR